MWIKTTKTLYIGIQISPPFYQFNNKVILGSNNPKIPKILKKNGIFTL